MAHFQALGRCVNDLQWESNAHNGIWFSVHAGKKCINVEKMRMMNAFGKCFPVLTAEILLFHIFFFLMSVLCLFCLFHFLISVSLYFFPLFSWSDSGFGSSFLPKEESATTAPEVVLRKDYQASSQVSLLLTVTGWCLNLEIFWNLFLLCLDRI